MLRIALIIDSLVSAGAQRQMVLLANGLASRGHAVSLLIYHDILDLAAELDDENIQLETLKKTSKVDIRFLFRLASKLRSIQPDVVLTFLSGPGLWTQIAGRLAKVPAIVTSERNIDFVHSRKDVLIAWLVNRWSTKVVVNTLTAKKRLQERVNIPASRIVVIPNGVDTKKFRPFGNAESENVRRQYDLRPDDFVVVLPGRIEVQKNHLCLVDALSHLDLDATRVRVCFFGADNDISFRDKIINKIRNLELGERITFRGVSNDMPAIYNMADVVVLPSSWEGLPNVILEAMSCGRPVIVSDIADNRQLVADGRVGILFENDNSKQLAGRLELLIGETKENRRLLGESARAHIVKNYSPESNLRAFDSLLQSIVGQ